jgi:hypothetical protein
MAANGRYDQSVLVEDYVCKSGGVSLPYDFSRVTPNREDPTGGCPVFEVADQPERSQSFNPRARQEYAPLSPQ